jgi:hypothetical protein
MTKTLLAVVLIALGFCPSISWAQLAPGKGKDRCGSSFNIEQLKQYEPAAYQKWLAIEKHTQKYIQGRQALSNGTVSPSPQRVSDASVTVTIPVVVHVVFNAAVENISDAQIQSQIDVLNEDFRRLNADAGQTPNQFAGAAADLNIVFKLACVDPNGNPTNGIERANTSITGFRFSSINPTTPNETAIGVKFVSGAAAWPSNTYLNIWTCNFVDGTLGYARFPGTAASNVDGVVIAYNAMGRVGPLLPKYNKGRTASHEIGHWLNLFHVWGDSNCGDDLCADTPTQQGPNYGCVSFPHRTCSNNGDMSMNYMDYSDDACMNLFTNNQKDRARANFAAGGFRESFISAKIQEQVSQVCSGPVTFSVVANQGAAVTYKWTVTGALQLASGQGGNQITCNQNGTGTATITVSANGYCDSKTIQVGPLSTTDIIGMDPSTYFSAGQTVTLSVNESAFGYNWYIYGGAIVGSSTGQSVTVQLDNCFSGQTANNDFDANVTLTDGCGTGSIYHEHTYATCPGGLSPTFLTIAPNPASSTTEVFLSEKGNMRAKGNIREIKIVDMWGTIRHTSKYERGKTSILLDISSLPNNIYTVFAFDGKNWISSKLVKN